MPVATMIAGPNGSGKSTLIAELLRNGIELGDYFNADDIARTLAGDPQDVARRAQQQVRDLRENAVRSGRDYAFETVMSHPSHIDHLAWARENGFETRLLFVCTENPEFNVGRVANRVLHGGHDVPVTRIEQRYRRSLANLPAAIAVSDQALVFDNSYRDRPFLCLAEIREGSLRHLAVRKTRTGVAIDLPDWWRRALPLIKPADPFRDGRLAR